jgi:hypothetical protein
MSRPPLGKLNVGDELIMMSGVPGRRDGKRASAVRVVTVGRKYVHVVLAEYFEAYTAAAPEARSWRWSTRKFLIEDQQEGERGKRVGYSASVATAEQHAYDLREMGAADYLREQGIDLRHNSPWRGREVELASLLRFVETPGAAPDA